MNDSGSSSSSRRGGNANRGRQQASVPIALPNDALAANIGEVLLQFVNPFSSAAYISLSELSATGLWAFIAANCGTQVAAFQLSWTEKNLRGSIIARFHPADFDAELLREFPTMSVSVRISIFNFVKLFVSRDLAANHALKAYVDPAIGKLWADSTYEQPVAKRLRDEPPHGGGNPLFTPLKRSAQAFVFGSPAVSDTASSGINAPSFGSNAPPLGISSPPFGNNALPHGSNAPPHGNIAPPYGFSASDPGAGALPHGNVAPPPPPPNSRVVGIPPAGQLSANSAQLQLQCDRV